MTQLHDTQNGHRNRSHLTQHYELSAQYLTIDHIIAARNFVDRAVTSAQPIYGVTTAFGAMANTPIPPHHAAHLQNNMIWHLRTGAGHYLCLHHFNQNINSQGFGSANLSWRALEVMRHYVSAALLFGIQAVDLRTMHLYGHYDASQLLSAETNKLYKAVHEVIGIGASEKRPYVWNDDEQVLEVHQELLAKNIASWGQCHTSCGQRSPII